MIDYGCCSASSSCDLVSVLFLRGGALCWRPGHHTDGEPGQNMNRAQGDMTMVCKIHRRKHGLCTRIPVRTNAVQASGKSSLFTARWPRNGLFAKQFLSAGALGNPSEGAGGLQNFKELPC